MVVLRFFRNIINSSLIDKIFYRYILTTFLKITRVNLKKRKLLRLEVDIVDHCNLNCNCCSHFSPLADEKYMDIDIFEEDCELLSGLTKGQIKILDLMGGEPLLHPDINKFIKISRQYFPIGEISIITNGILLKKMNSIFWKMCYENNIKIIVSSYPIKLDIHEIRTIANNYNVILNVRGQNDGKLWKKIPLDINGKQNNNNNFIMCSEANNCIQLKNGKLATCRLPFAVNHFNTFFKYNIPIEENDYININQIRDIDEILEFLRKPPPICKYCNQKDISYNINWYVSKKEILEWT